MVSSTFITITKVKSSQIKLDKKELKLLEKRNNFVIEKEIEKKEYSIIINYEI